MEMDRADHQINEFASIQGLHYETGKRVEIRFKDGIILEISEAPDSIISNHNLFVAPGLFDNQVNGYCGVDFSDGGLTPGQVKRAAKSIWKDGVTSFLPTILTNSHKNLIRNFRNIAEVTKNNLLRDSIPGFHLEGPYISAEEGFCGCHPAEFIRKPSWIEFNEYQKAANGKIIQVTVAPEVDGAMQFIDMCFQNWIHVAIGHTNASSRQINEAVERGARLSTHLGNGCANLSDRHRNPLWPQLANDLLTPSIIADGHHLLPEEIKVFLKVKGAENIILTSDVNHLIGMPPGNYVYMGSDIVYTDDGLVKNPKLNCLAGASFPLKRGVETMMNFTGCPLGVAINMATKNVAKVYNLSDRGSIAPGKRADLILFEMAGNKLIIKQTWLKGNLVFSDL